MKDLVATLRPALMLLIVFSILCGIVYPYAITGAAQTLFPRQAEGDPDLIGQTFSSPGHFWSRPSATSYDASTSSGTNLGPTNPALADGVQARVDALRAADPDNHAPIPVDLVTSSASGLDPDISPAAAYYQAHRVAVARHLDEARVRALVDARIEERTFGVLGERRVNVVGLNRALDQLAGGTIGTR
jgi:K+-transporting ATPase ATPase C chain